DAHGLEQPLDVPEGKERAWAAAAFREEDRQAIVREGEGAMEIDGAAQGGFGIRVAPHLLEDQRVIEVDERIELVLCECAFAGGRGGLPAPFVGEPSNVGD